MTCSHNEIRRQLAGQYYTNQLGSDAVAVDRSVPTSLGSGLWSPGIAVGLLTLFIFSAVIGIIAVLRVLI